MKLMTVAIALVSVGILGGCVDDSGYRSGGYSYSSAGYYRSYDRDRYYRDRYYRDYRRDWRSPREEMGRRYDRRDWRGEQTRQPQSGGNNRVIRPHILYRNAD